MHIPKLNRYTRLAALIGMVLASATAPGQDDKTASAPARYEVELIVFRHLEQALNTRESAGGGSLIQESPLSLNRAADAAESPLTSIEIAGAEDAFAGNIVGKADEKSGPTIRGMFFCCTYPYIVCILNGVVGR